MKKFYIQPATEQFEANLVQALCNVSVIDTTTDGMTSEAPARATKGLKYLSI